jgi:2-polyprenyl-3-methyl-5-hydroxy-6-metoxy-1,4-benzoquinol methylase
MSSPDLSKVFDEKYFEDGVRNRVSAYENYRWMPERTIREASSIINNIPFDNVLDYGCAKGFMVYAMRLLGKEAFGVDVSDYAVKNSHPKVRDYLSVIQSAEDIKGGWDLIIAKDVLEHIPKELLPETLAAFRRRCKHLFVAVPLGDGRRYRIREYEMDVTHIIREPEEWWLTTIVEAGFKIKYFDYQFHHLKENWTVNHPHGNAFIVAE